jgi:hypothetical protein
MDAGSIATTIGVGIFTAGVGAVIHLWASSKSSAEFKGVVSEKVAAMEEDIERLEAVDDQQWNAINSQRRDLTETREDVAEMKGRMSAQTKVNGAASGRT